MDRRKASPEQLNMLLHFLEEDKELAVGKTTGLDAKIRQTKSWIKITEKLNANAGFSSGAIKTPDKWQQTWRDWKSNVKKKALKIRKNRFAPRSSTNNQLTEAEDKILNLICTKTKAFGLTGVPETMITNNEMGEPQEGNMMPGDLCHPDPSTSSMKWPPEPQQHHYNNGEADMNLEDGVGPDIDPSLGPNDGSTGPSSGKPWKRGRPVRLVHDRLLILEEERIRIEKQKLLEKKRCNNLRLKLEKDRLDMERQRNALLEKLLVAVESVAHRH